MWWEEALRWGIVILAIVWGSFVVWRRMRPEYPEEEVLTVIGWLTLAAAVGPGLVKWVGVWGMLGPVVVVLWWQTRLRKWDFWEWADFLGVVSLWTGAMLVGARGRGVVAAMGVFLGVVAARVVGRYYRRFRWYKSGKSGLVGVVSLLWWALLEIGVETIDPHTIYWVGLTVAQWLAVAALIIGTVAVYLRSGLTLATQIWRRIRPKSRG